MDGPACLGFRFAGFADAFGASRGSGSLVVGGSSYVFVRAWGWRGGRWVSFGLLAIMRESALLDSCGAMVPRVCMGEFFSSRKVVGVGLGWWNGISC